MERERRERERERERENVYLSVPGGGIFIVLSQLVVTCW